MSTVSPLVKLLIHVKSHQGVAGFCACAYVYVFRHDGFDWLIYSVAAEPKLVRPTSMMMNNSSFLM
jgi:hypothetical protein